jgi:hypothetical protein
MYTSVNSYEYIRFKVHIAKVIRTTVDSCKMSRRFRATAYFFLLSGLADSSTLKTEAICSSEMLVDT